jgi:serine-type D-Ala-D-Ala carboxypeptidase (penicillin-binding protein 5/6)
MKDFQKLRKTLKIRSKPFREGGQLLLLPLICFIVFLVVFQIHQNLEKEISRYDLSSFSEKAPLSPYPVLHSYLPPSLSAQAAAVMDDEAKVFLYLKNPKLRFSMASTTKLMSALVALEYFSLDDQLLVYSEGIEGSTVGLRRGERYSLESLLYALLLPSANDAAYVLADNYPGGRDSFVKRMNGKARELHLSETQYDDPAGLEDDANHTTVTDLARLASLAIENETIRKIVGTKSKVISDSSGQHVIPVENLNKLLGVNGVIGIKTGFTQGAGGVLTTAKKENGHILIIVVMRSIDRFGDTEQLLDLVSGNVSYIETAYKSVTVPKDLPIQ